MTGKTQSLSCHLYFFVLHLYNFLHIKEVFLHPLCIHLLIFELDLFIVSNDNISLVQ